MRTILAADAADMGRWVARHAAADLRAAIDQQGQANIVVATGASQFEVLGHLVQEPGVDWSRVHGFHLDEYVGLGADHPASFCGYLKQRFVDKVSLASFEFLPGKEDPREVIRRVGDKLAGTRIDLALVGIGENGHLAFNDPPADFETTDPYLLVELDEPCRTQQVGEGWFGSLEEVPTHAISMSVRQILKSAKIYCSVPDERKAAAVKGTLEGPITPELPASILRQHDQAILVIDESAAGKLSDETRAASERA